MLIMITGIGLLVHIFSIWYMDNKEGYSRFFAYTNLFIASMAVLVLADNFLFMYMGWECVSICSYLLISFYYKRLYNVLCGFKAFILTRVSDIFLIIGMFLIYRKYGTFNFDEIKFLSNFMYLDYSSDVNIITFCLLAGIIGKSAQLPLHTWLSDAMVGPSPISALIHAATMVTSGIYLVSRTYFLFILTPKILYVLSVISIATILISSFSALCQTDIKRILAYSTMSQIGYMFLALSVQSWTAAITHLVVHAVFKALLFLSAGSLIISCNNEKNIFKMSSNLYKKLPLLYVSFLVGGGSLIGFPLITAGFYSKGNILFSVFQSGHTYLFLIGLFCSFLTVLYTFRMILVVFHNNSSIYDVRINSTLIHDTPLIILIILSTVFISYTSLPLFYVFPEFHFSETQKIMFEITSGMLSFLGIWCAYYIWIKNRHLTDSILNLKCMKYFYNLVVSGWGIDVFYNFFFIRFYLYISAILSSDPLNKITHFFKYIIHVLNANLLRINNGYLRWYIASMIIGINSFFILVLLFTYFHSHVCIK
jgi:NADH-quinone oxidoreductase subunit L